VADAAGEVDELVTNLYAQFAFNVTLVGKRLHRECATKSRHPTWCARRFPTAN